MASSSPWMGRCSSKYKNLPSPPASIHPFYLGKSGDCLSHVGFLEIGIQVSLCVCVCVWLPCFNWRVWYMCWGKGGWNKGRMQQEDNCQEQELRPWQRSWGRRLGIRKGEIEPQESPWKFSSIYPQNQSLHTLLLCALTYTSDFTGPVPHHLSLKKS